MVTCTNCGNPDVGGKFCGLCGTPASPSAAASPGPAVDVPDVPSAPPSSGQFPGGSLPPVAHVPAYPAPQPYPTGYSAAPSRFCVTDLLRDIGVIALLCWAIFLDWMPDKPGTTVWILLPLVFGVLAPLGPHFMRLLTVGSPHLLALARILLLVPTGLALGACVVLDIVNTFATSPSGSVGLSPGVLVAAFGLGIGLVPRNVDLDRKLGAQSGVAGWRLASGLLVLVGIGSLALSSVVFVGKRLGWDKLAQVALVDLLLPIVMVLGLLGVIFGRPAVRLVRQQALWQPVLLAAMVGFLASKVLSPGVQLSSSNVESISAATGLWILALGAGLSAVTIRQSASGDSGSADFWVGLVRAAISTAMAFFLVFAVFVIGRVSWALIQQPGVARSLSVAVVFSIVVKLLAGAACVVAAVRLRSDVRTGRLIALAALSVALILLLVDVYALQWSIEGKSAGPGLLTIAGPILLAMGGLVVSLPLRASYGSILPETYYASQPAPVSGPVAEPVAGYVPAPLAVQAPAPVPEVPVAAVPVVAAPEAPVPVVPATAPTPWSQLPPPSASALVAQSLPAQAPASIPEAPATEAIPVADRDAVMASDPSTDPSVLMDIAARRLDLHVRLAQNPRSYDALLGWLYDLGDSQVREILARRGFSK